MHMILQKTWQRGKKWWWRQRWRRWWWNCFRMPDDDRDICIFDYYVDESGEWDLWTGRVPHATFNNSWQLLGDVFVNTVNTVSHSFIRLLPIIIITYAPVSMINHFIFFYHTHKICFSSFKRSSYKYWLSISYLIIPPLYLACIQLYFWIWSYR